MRLQGKIEAATLKVAVERATQFIDLTVASRARYKNVFLVPPGPLIKKAPLSWLFILDIIVLNAHFCSKFSKLTDSRSATITSKANSSVFPYRRVHLQ